MSVESMKSSIGSGHQPGLTRSHLRTPASGQNPTLYGGRFVVST